MASGFGHDGVARCDGKRKRSGGRNTGVCGSGSGDGQEYPGDPPTALVPAGLRGGVTGDSAFLGVMTETSFHGVRVRVVVEIRGWAGKGRDGKRRDFNMDVKMLEDVGMLKDVEMEKVVAAIIHDLARLYWSYWNSYHPVKSLNIHRVEEFIRKQILEEKDCIGKDLLNEYVRDNPLTWVDMVSGSKEFTVLKKDIAERALPFFKVLKDAITKEQSRAGRQRQDEDQIFPAVEGVVPLGEADKEIQRLKDQVASLEVTNAEKDATITSLLEILVPGNMDFNSSILGPEVSLQDIQHLSDQITDLEVTYAAKLKAKDAELMAKGAELKAKDDRIASLEEKLLTAQGGYLITPLRSPSPTTGFVVSPVATGAGPGVSSGCKFTPLFGLVSSIDWSFIMFVYETTV